MNSTYLYLLIFAYLIGATDAEVNLSSIIPSYNVYVIVLLAISASKALLVAMFFQHLRYEPRSLAVWGLLGLVIASLLMSLTFLQLHTSHSASIVP